MILEGLLLTQWQWFKVSLQIFCCTLNIIWIMHLILNKQKVSYIFRLWSVSPPRGISLLLKFFQAEAFAYRTCFDTLKTMVNKTNCFITSRIPTLANRNANWKKKMKINQVLIQIKFNCGVKTFFFRFLLKLFLQDMKNSRLFIIDYEAYWYGIST